MLKTGFKGKGGNLLKHKFDLLHGNIRNVFLNYLLPSVGGMLGISLYVLGDTLLVGRGLGSSGLAALNISIPILNIFSGIGLLLGVGGATIVSILKGQGKTEDIDEVFTISFTISFIIGLLMTIFGLIYLEELSMFMGASKGKILNMSTEYLRPLIIGSIFFVINSLLIIFIRNDNGPRLVMRAMLTSSISNIILDYIFIFIFNLGMMGAGLATVLSPIISLAILSTHFLKRRNTIKFGKIKVKSESLKRIILNGIPSFIIETMAGIVIFIFNIAILKIRGNIGVSAYSIVANLSLFCSAVFNGIGQAIQPIVSINHGARKYERSREVVRLAVYTSLGIGIFFFLIGLIFPRQLTNIFINEVNPELILLSITGIRLYFISFIFMGLNTVIVSYLQSMEYSRASISISIGRGLVFVILGITILPIFFGINGVWLTTPLAEVATLIYAIKLYKPYNLSLD